MNDFLSVWQSGTALEAPEAIALVRRFTLACVRAFLQRLGVPDAQWPAIERTALGRFLVSLERVRYYGETPQVEIQGMVIYFKSFTSERFSRFERVMLFRRNQGSVGLAIRIPLGSEDDRLFRPGPVFAGLLWWNEGPGSDRAAVQAALAEAWGREPAWFGRQECGERAMLGRRFDPGEWMGGEAELAGEIADLLAAGLAALERLRLSRPADPGSALPPFAAEQPDPALRLHKRLHRRGYRFTLEQVATFYAALKAKGFVILSGLSGTGKTKLAQEFAAALGLDDDHFLLEPVKPDWRDNTGLLGYWNPVTGEYAAPPFLRLLLAAAEEYRGGKAPARGQDLPDYIRQRLGEAGIRTRLQRHREALEAVGDGNWTEDQLRHLWQDWYNGIGRLRPVGQMRVDAATLRRATEHLADRSLPLPERALGAMRILQLAGVDVPVRVRVIRALATLEPGRVPAVSKLGILRAACRALGRPNVAISRRSEGLEFTHLANAWEVLEQLCAPLMRELGLDPADGAAFTLVVELAAEYERRQRRPGGEWEDDAEDDEDEPPEEAVRPYFVVLDEMNLARVEYYLADILSVLETGRREDGFTRGEILLHGQAEDVLASGGLRVPPRLRLPPNVYFIGTVNTDETTFAFSPKVLDRAFTIEVRDVDLTDYPPAVEPPAAAAGLDGAVLPDQVGDVEEALLADFTRSGRFAQITKADVAGWGRSRREYVALLDDLNQRLLPHDFGFGYRVVDEILAFMGALRESPFATALSEDEAFDAAVMMKVLPKFHGPLNRVKPPLEAVLAWAGDRFERTAAKAAQMLDRAAKVGHTRFA